MKRTALSHTLRNSWFCLGSIMLLMSLAAQPAPINAQEQRFSADTLFRFVEEDIGLSGGEMTALKNGRVLTKQLDTNIKHEIAMFGMARIDVPASAFMIRYNQGALSVELIKTESWGLLGDPPQLADLEGLAVPSTDIGELWGSNVGESKIKGPVDLLDAFRDLDSSAADYQQQADGVLRAALLAYVREYARHGNAGLIEYHDKKTPVKVADEFQGILAQSSELNTIAPELPALSAGYPQTQLLDGVDYLFWMIEDFGGQAKRPTISLNHRVSYQPEAGSLILASKQLYATHY